MVTVKDEVTVSDEVTVTVRDEFTVTVRDQFTVRVAQPLYPPDNRYRY
jgi:hypothetical protein